MKSLFDDLDIDEFLINVREENVKYNDIHKFTYVDPFPWDSEHNAYLRFFKETISNVSINIPVVINGIHTKWREIEVIPYSRYLMSLKENRILERYEYVYHINLDMKDDRIENLKIIDTRSRDIKVKHPYNPEEYIGKLQWRNDSKTYYIRLILKKDKKRIDINISDYIAETEILKRKLKENENAWFKDNDRTNLNFDNIFIKVFEEAKYPFEKCYLGEIYINKRSGRRCIPIYSRVNGEFKSTGMLYARYLKQVELGRFLTKNEIVDHIDSNRLNDNIKNLQVLTVDEHLKKSAQDQNEMAPEIEICCSGCNKEFIRYLRYVRVKLKYSKLNNLFCSPECYNKNQNKVQYKKIIKYTCAGTGLEIELPENAKFLPSRFNPDALPFYDFAAVSKWIRDNDSGSF